MNIQFIDIVNILSYGLSIRFLYLLALTWRIRWRKFIAKREIAKHDQLLSQAKASGLKKFLIKGKTIYTSNYKEAQRMYVARKKLE